MINRHNEITSFLKYTYKIKSKYEDSFNLREIYSLLSSYGLYKDEVQSLYSENYFAYFIEFYKDNNNIDVFFDKSQKDYLQANNIASTRDYNFIKLYINISKDDYFDVVKKLLDFLSKNPDIKHLSSISKVCRSDQIVIRVRTIEDALRISHFINGDLSIVNTLRYPNPFLFRDKLIGYSFDNELSFSTSISYLINEYLESKNAEEEINADDFVYFVKTYYNDIINKDSFDNYDKLINSDMFTVSYNRMKSNNPNTTINDTLSNLLYIFEQFYRLYDEDDDLKLYHQLYEYSKSHDKNIERIEYLNIKYNIYSDKKVLDEYIKFAFAKYNDYEEVAHRITEFAKAKVSNLDSYYQYITREKDFRSKFINISPDHIYMITNNDIYGYVDKIIKINYLNDYND